MYSASPQLDAIPRAAVSGAIFRGEEVLLVERAKPPMHGAWSLPGGHIELGETAPEAMERELAEETGIQARLSGVADVVDVIRRDGEGEGGAVSFHRVIVVFYGIWLGGEAQAADDVSAVTWRRPSDIAILRTTPRLADVVAGAWARLSTDRAGA